MGQLQEVEAELLELGYQLIFIVPDSPEKIQAAISKQNYHYTILSDSKMDAAKSFGIAWEYGEDLIKRYAGYGLDLQEASGESHQLLPVPAVFIINKKGTIKFEYVNPDHRVRIAPSVVPAAARPEARA